MLRHLRRAQGAILIALVGLIASVIQVVDIITQAKFSLLGISICVSAGLLLGVIAVRNWRRASTGGSPPTPTERRILLISAVVCAFSLVAIAATYTAVSVLGPVYRPSAPEVAMFELPDLDSHPAGIVRGPDGNIWFAEHDSDKIGRTSSNGEITEFEIPTRGGHPFAITVGPDGNLWFTEGKPDAKSGNRIGRISPLGDVREFPLPTEDANPVGITTGPDGNLWFTEYNSDKIGRITPDGRRIDEFPLPPRKTNGSDVSHGRHPNQITTGPDGALWFTEFFGDQLGRITIDGAITEFPIPTPDGHPVDIVAGVDGDLWFTEFDGNRIGRMSTQGEIIAEFDLRTAQAGPAEITVGSDNQLWFTELKASKIGRVTTDGRVSEYPLPAGGDQPQGIARGDDSELWFTMPAGDQIGRFSIQY